MTWVGKKTSCFFVSFLVDYIVNIETLENVAGIFITVSTHIRLTLFLTQFCPR